MAPSWLTRVTCRWAAMLCCFLMCVRAGGAICTRAFHCGGGPSRIRGLQPSSKLRIESLQPFTLLFPASHQVPALAEEKIRLSPSLLRSALPPPEAAPAACQAPHRYRELGDRSKLLPGSWNRGRVEGKPPVLTERVKRRQVVQTCSSGRILLTSRLQSFKEMKGNGA